GDVPREPAPSPADARAIAGRLTFRDASARSSSEARESLLDRYRRAGSSVLSSSTENARTRPAEHAPELSRARVASAGLGHNDVRNGSHTAIESRRPAKERAATSPSPAEDVHRKQADSLARLSSVHASNPAIAKKKLLRGESLSAGTSIGVQVGLAAA